MNLLAAEAEMAVRDCRWGEGLGGVAAHDKDFVELNALMYFSHVRKLAEEQEVFGKKMSSKVNSMT